MNAQATTTVQPLVSFARQTQQAEAVEAFRRNERVTKRVDALMYDLQMGAVSAIIEQGLAMAIAANWMGDVFVSLTMTDAKTGVWMYHIPSRGELPAFTTELTTARTGILTLLGVEVF